MEKLTLLQEIEILEKLINGKIIGTGSSRVVYKHPHNEKYAIKIANFSGGMNQSILEIKINEMLPQYTNTIHAYGERIIICDLIVRDLLDEINYYFNNEDEEKKEEMMLSPMQISKIEKIIYELNKINGETPDHYQIGVNINNEIVAYDYGFSLKKDGWSQIDCLKHQQIVEAPKIALKSLRG